MRAAVWKAVLAVEAWEVGAASRLQAALEAATAEWRAGATESRAASRAVVAATMAEPKPPAPRLPAARMAAKAPQAATT